MKNLLIILLLLPFSSQSQVDKNTAHNSSVGFSTVLGTGKTRITTFYNSPLETQGSYYLFDSWNNLSLIYTLDKKRFMIKSMNVNLNNNSFQTKSSKDSVFTINTDNIYKIVINKRTFKKIKSEDKAKVYEIIYESKNFSILKNYNFWFVQGSVNPMKNRMKNKYHMSSKYFVKQGDKISKFKLKKKWLLKLFQDEGNREKFKTYMNSNNLSYKDEVDVQRALKFTLN